MPAEFEHATAVHELADGDAGEPPESGRRRWRYGAEVAPGWDIAGVPNGGYLMAIAGRAMIAATGRSPLTVTAHYLRPARSGPCVVEIDEVRSGRRMTTLDVRLVGATTDGGREYLRLLATVAVDTGWAGEAATDPGPTLLTLDPPPLPFDECTVGDPPKPGEINAGFRARVSLRVRQRDLGFTSGQPSGTPEVEGWFAFPDQQPDEALDACAVLFAADAFFPPVFNLGGGVNFAWVPTVELTVHLRRPPAPGPLQARFFNTVVGHGLLNEDGVLWDHTGAVVAQSRQLALLPRPT